MQRASPKFIALSSVVMVLLSPVLGLGCDPARSQSEDQAHFVSSIVHEQYLSFMRAEAHSGEPANGLDRIVQSLSVGRAKGWPDDSAALGNWLLEEWARMRSPSRLEVKLDQFAREDGAFMNPKRQAILESWRAELATWSVARSNSASSDADRLFDRVREQYSYAKGLQMVSRCYDATPLFLQVIVDLSRFVELSPWDPRVSEALFLLGDSYLALRWILPESVRSDRILNLCAESCQSGVWASQSLLRRKEVLGDDA